VIQIKTFADQDSARTLLQDLAAARAEHVVHQVDLTTSGGDGLSAFEAREAEEFPAYSEFRRWLGATVGQALLSFAGTVLASSSVDDDGRVSISDEKLGESADKLDKRAGLAQRLQWLVDEIPSLQAFYRQLYDAEAVRAKALCAVVDALDLGTPAGFKRAVDLWPEMETIYLWAQPGARIARLDPEAVEGARAALDRWAQRIAEKEEEQVRARGLASGDITPETDDDLRIGIAAAEAEIDEIQAKLKATEKAVADLRARQDDASTRLLGLLQVAGERGLE